MQDNGRSFKLIVRNIFNDYDILSFDETIKWDCKSKYYNQYNSIFRGV